MTTADVDARSESGARGTIGPGGRPRAATARRTSHGGSVGRLLVALWLLGITARVASADDAATARARQHFERGEKLYAATKFSDALGEYQQAFDAVPLAGFLFNIGQCYRNLGDYDAAVFSYRQYLKLAPAAANRDQVEQLIRELEAKRDQRDTERLGLRKPPPPVEPPPPAPASAERSLLRTWWFWTAVGVVAAAGGVTIYEVTRPAGGPPATDLGNIVFGK
jgi:tetratricopeptide (TPR) repeat protein